MVKRATYNREFLYRPPDMADIRVKEPAPGKVETTARTLSRLESKVWGDRRQAHAQLSAGLERASRVLLLFTEPALRQEGQDAIRDATGYAFVSYAPRHKQSTEHAEGNPAKLDSLYMPPSLLTHPNRASAAGIALVHAALWVAAEDKATTLRVRQGLASENLWPQVGFEPLPDPPMTPPSGEVLHPEFWDRASERERVTKHIPPIQVDPDAPIGPPEESSVFEVSIPIQDDLSVLLPPLVGPAEDRTPLEALGWLAQRYSWLQQ